MKNKYCVTVTHNPLWLCWLACPKGVSVVDGGGETPGPIPNPEAKPARADGTALGRVWESRLPSTQQLQNHKHPAQDPLWSQAGCFCHAPGGTGIIVQPARITPVLCLVAANPIQHHSTTPQPRPLQRACATYPAEKHLCADIVTPQTPVHPNAYRNR